MDEFNPHYFFDLDHYEHQELFKNCQYVWQPLTLLQQFFKEHSLGHIETAIPETVSLIDSHLIKIGQGTRIESGVHIQGPCIIGKNCEIRQGAYIRGNFVCGNHCVIGHTTEIKDSIFLNGAKAAHFAYVANSILGNEVNLGAGTKCANLRFDKRPIRLFFNGRAVDTGLKKFGAIFGDLSQSGCNSVTNPGTLLGKRALIAPCTNAKGFIREGRIFLMDGSTENLVYHQGTS